MWKKDLLFLVLISADRLTLVLSANGQGCSNCAEQADGYFLATGCDDDGCQSCDQACAARGQSCNLDLLKHAASGTDPSDWAICACILEGLGKSFSRDSNGHVIGGRYADNHAGCVFDKSAGVQVLRKNNEDPTCAQVTKGKQRVCSCAAAGTKSTCRALGDQADEQNSMSAADFLALLNKPATPSAPAPAGAAPATAVPSTATPAAAAPVDDSSADVIWIIVGICGAVGICTIAACLGLVLSRRKAQPVKTTTEQPAAVNLGASPPAQVMEEAKKAEEEKTDIVAPKNCQVMVGFNAATSEDEAKELTQFLITNGFPTFSTCVYCPANPGSDWKTITNTGVATAKVLVALITKGWLASQECRTETITFQNRMNAANKKVIIPVIFPCITKEDHDDPASPLFNMGTVQQIKGGRAANPKWMEDVLQGVSNASREAMP